MKIKTISFVLLACAATVSFFSCKNDYQDDPVSGLGKELRLKPSVAAMEQTEVSLRSAGNHTFFVSGDKISVQVTTSNGKNGTYPYTFNGTEFTGGFLFPADNTFITELVALWPGEGGGTELITDQRKYNDYRQSDRMRAVGSTENIMPTEAPVPLVFTHEQSRVVFRLAGQNANGLYIKSLLLEMDDKRESGGLGKLAFWAYCGDGTEDPDEGGKGSLNAQLILPSGIHLKSETTNGERMKIGLVTVGSKDTNEKDYRGIIYIPASTDIEMKSNHEYVVTLTPEGYDLDAQVYIAGFPQSEGHVGVPYQLPVYSAENNVYEISTLAQLVTLSWLLSGETLPDWWNPDNLAWGDFSYDITNDITVSDKLVADGQVYFIQSAFTSMGDKITNKDRVKFSDGTPVF